jgi:hypothetical protein
MGWYALWYFLKILKKVKAQKILGKGGGAHLDAHRILLKWGGTQIDTFWKLLKSRKSHFAKIISIDFDVFKFLIFVFAYID